MTDVKTYPGTLYSYSAGCYVGVLVTDPLLRKLAALQLQHLQAVKRLLTDAPEGQVFPAMWTLHHPEGKQTQVDFIDTSIDVRERIRSASIMPPPRACFPVFIAGSMQEAEAMADAHHAMLHPPVAAAETAP